MRTHGTLTRWNDDRGFGFITPAKGSPEIFVHISEFPREGGRPRLNELISFEVVPGPDGKQRAVRVMRPGQKAVQRPVSRDRQQARGFRIPEALVLLALVAIGVYAYSQFRHRSAQADSGGSAQLATPESPPSRYSCDGRTICSQMRSCEEAKYFIRNCPNTKMDGNSDGVPCESQWCN